ncbi:hypothetical protein PMZ80_009246 [Knufia obscura]|uniref:Choline kinase N-terminal domain-containing protein n=2 Tax=Knufia TaxID=430999 RepID=A0AAN8EDP2_9EURO|nr:hypothetical protein PMZ80_009246 [Knufia obscura]KAK5949013.1 hypothetical protein OHC33_009934 [Knufia fluminis]
MNPEVKIFDEPEHIEPPSYADEPSPTLVAQSPKLHRASISGRKMVGRSERPPLKTMPSDKSLTTQMSSFNLENPEKSAKQAVDDDDDDQALLNQVMQWLQLEKSKRSNGQADSDANAQSQKGPRDHDLSLEKLERILTKFSGSSLGGSMRAARRRSTQMGGRRGSIARALMKGQRSAYNSETDNVDAVAVVPHIEASLDNTKTMSYSGGSADTTTADPDKTKEQGHWEIFKQDILRLTHTLGLRGWRRLPIEYGDAITVERLSGALTNAVYVVKPPKDYTLMQRKDDQGNIIPIKKQPKELLLRIYGPNVEHLIDRESELMILRRLAAKNIGPKLLGYFDNGRFEEFLHARTLQPQDIRDPSTSKQIAKRFRELHDGIDLLESERRSGAFVFANWDKWVDRVEKVITWLDQQVQGEQHGKAPASPRYTRQGLICGVEWKMFREAYDKYRAKLIQESGGESGIRKRLVFAHNDAQYGNLMMLQPAEKSPLSEPTNQHKRLVVIDFEYANANTRGLEFANHFTEWCYDYHHPERSFACNANMYPKPEEQHRFVRAYVMHRPQFAASASATPNLEAREKTSIPDFMLDARAPGGGYGFDYEAEERAREKVQEQEIEELLRETRNWRIANHAQWVAWGIVQAKVPELDEPPKKSIAGAMVDKVKSAIYPRSDPLDEEVKERQEEAKHDRPEGRGQEEAHQEGDGQEEEEDFNYLAYAQERAMFFWGDCILMGIVKEEDLPEAMRPHVKYVKY